MERIHCLYTPMKLAWDVLKQLPLKALNLSAFRDQTTIDPDTVVASVVFDFKIFHKWAIEQYMNGELTGNKVHEAGINEGIFVPVYTDNISQEVKDAVDKGLQDFKDGKVDLTAMFAE